MQKGKRGEIEKIVFSVIILVLIISIISFSFFSISGDVVKNTNKSKVSKLFANLRSFVLKKQISPIQIAETLRPDPKSCGLCYYQTKADQVTEQAFLWCEDIFNSNKIPLERRVRIGISLNAIINKELYLPEQQIKSKDSSDFEVRTSEQKVFKNFPNDCSGLLFLAGTHGASYDEEKRKKILSKLLDTSVESCVEFSLDGGVTYIGLACQGGRPDTWQKIVQERIEIFKKEHPKSCPKIKSTLKFTGNMFTSTTAKNGAIQTLKAELPGDFITHYSNLQLNDLDILKFANAFWISAQAFYSGAPTAVIWDPSTNGFSCLYAPCSVVTGNKCSSKDIGIKGAKCIDDLDRDNDRDKTELINLVCCNIPNEGYKSRDRKETQCLATDKAPEGKCLYQYILSNYRDIDSKKYKIYNFGTYDYNGKKFSCIDDGYGQLWVAKNSLNPLSLANLRNPETSTELCPSGTNNWASCIASILFTDEQGIPRIAEKQFNPPSPASYLTTDPEGEINIANAKVEYKINLGITFPPPESLTTMPPTTTAT